jgi:hypothetical protein
VIGHQVQQQHTVQKQQQINVTLNVVVDILGVIVNVSLKVEYQFDDEELHEVLHGKM